MNDGTKDEFELHLRNLISKEWGGAFAANNLKIKFPEAQGIEICEVGVKPGNEPLYLEIMDRNGHKQRKFFVRSGNSSPPLDDPVEIAKHMAVRFPQLMQR